MSNELVKRLEMLQDTVEAGKRAVQHIAKVEAQVAQLMVDIDTAEQVVEQEHRDVVALEKVGLRSLFTSVLGGGEKRRDIEQQEYMQALLEYRSLHRQLELATYEKELLGRQIARLPAAEKELSELLKTAERKIIYNNATISSKLKDIDLLTSLSSARSREVKEAQDVCQQIETKIKALLTYLRKVHQWTPYQHPMHGKGRYSSYKKKTYIDRSQDEVIEINHLFDRLSVELSDIYSDHYHGLHISEFETFIEDFYDHLITDWVLRTKLKTAIAGTQVVYDKLQRMSDALAQEWDHEQSRYTALIKQKESIVAEHLLDNQQS